MHRRTNSMGSTPEGLAIQLLCHLESPILDAWLTILTEQG